MEQVKQQMKNIENQAEARERDESSRLSIEKLDRERQEDIKRLESKRLESQSVSVQPNADYLLTELAKRGREMFQFENREEAAKFVQLAQLRERGVEKGLAPEIINAQAQQLGLITAPTTTANADPVDPSIPSYARGYANSYRAREASATQRAIPAGAAGGWASNMVNAAEAQRRAAAAEQVAQLANSTVEHSAPQSPAANQEASAQTVYEAKLQQSLNNAIGLYGFLSDENSQGFKRVLEICELLKANKDPLLDDPDKPMIITQMVARELRIAPKASN